MRRLLPFSLLAALALPPAGVAQTRPLREPPREAERARGQAPEAARDTARDAAREAAERTRAAAAEEERLAGLRVTAAATLRTTETEVAERAAAVSDLAHRRAEAEVRLARHASTLAPMLPLLERLALFPAETLLVVPAPPGQALRGLAVLHGMARQLEQEAAGLRQEQASLQAQSRALQAALPALRAAQARQAELAQGLDAQLATAQGLRVRAEQAGVEAERRAAAEAARADSLRNALAVLDAAHVRAEAQARDDLARAERLRQDQAAAEARRRQVALARPAGPGLDPPPSPAGAGGGVAAGAAEGGAAARHLVAPVAGGVVRAWGERTDAGPATGVSYRPAPQARVVAPCPGRVRFSGPFRSFGQLMILDCGGGYAFVLAGLERLDVPVGAAVLAGEPVGTMPAWDATSSAARPALYLELRHDGVPVNPAPFLATPSLHARG